MSTRGGDAATLSAAIARGLAADGGLYLPERPLPHPVGAPPTAGLAELADWLLRPLFAGEPLAADLSAICREAFAFTAPLRWLDDGTALLELFHGPTAAFKDFGARFLASCLLRLPRAGGDGTVLVATSGDTGSAVAAAFHRRPGWRVVLLYPDGRVSPRQAHQLGAFGDNVRAFRVAGSFDDCQRLVKAAFADARLCERHALTSANSISLGRLLPQIVYWAGAALAAAAIGRAPITAVVPTGNLGNAFACVLARELGLPIARVVLATNHNRVLADLLSTGRYAPQPSLATLANAMDVGAPSNVERLLAWWPEPQRLPWLAADSVDDAAIRARIVAAADAHDVAICPHTACGLEVLARRRARGDREVAVVAATAHAAKFETIVEPLLGRRVEPPPQLAAILARPSRAEPLQPTLDALRHALA